MLLIQAIDNAAKRLNRQSCANLFGAGATQALKEADYRIYHLGLPQYFGGRPTVVVAAATVPQTRMVMINLDGPFVNPLLRFGGKTRYFNAVRLRNGKAATLNDDEFRALILLHELGHLTFKFPPDDVDNDTSLRNTTNVMSHCF